MSMRLTVLNAGQNYRVVGGSDSYQLQLGELLKSHGHCVIPFAAKHPENIQSKWSAFFPESSNFNGNRLADYFNYVYSIPARRSIGRLLDKANVDIAHLHIYYGKLTSSILKPLKDRGIPIIQTSHEFKLVCPVYQFYAHGEICEKCLKGRYYRVLLNRCNRGSLLRSGLSMVEAYASRVNGSIDSIDHIIAVSDFVREKLIKHGISESKITTVHNYIDASKFVPSFKEGSYLLYFGRFELNKGVLTLIKAAKIAKDVELVMVGAGAARKEMEKLVRNEGLKNVKILGFMDQAQLSEVIRGSICSIMPSELYETFGLTSIESFAYGRPVLASRIGGIPEVVEDKVDGFLFQAGAVTELAELMMWMWSNPEEALKMGRRGRKNVEHKFNSDKHYAEIMKVYNQHI